MTVSEMVTAVNYKLDAQTSLVSPVFFTTAEKVYWLNQAQLTLVKQKIFGTNYRQEGFEKSQKRIDDLASLVIEDSAPIQVTAASVYFPNTYYISISAIGDANNRYMFYLDSILRNTSDGTFYFTDQIPTKQVSKFLESSYNVPYLERFLVFFQDNRIYIIVDPNSGFSDEYLYLMVKFIKEPKELVTAGAAGYQVTTSELPIETHEEIINLAANMMLENIESDRVKTNEAQLAKME